MKHLSTEQIEQYLKNKTGLLKSLGLKQHLKKCPQCMELMQNAKDNVRLLKEVRDAVNDASNIVPEQIEQATLLNIKKKIEQ